MRLLHEISTVIPWERRIVETTLYEIGERLLRARQEAGYTQEALAEKIGCCVLSISRWENGLRPMKIMDIVHVTKVLHISADYLLGTGKTEIEAVERIADMSAADRKIVTAVLEALIEVLSSTKRLSD